MTDRRALWAVVRRPGRRGVFLIMFGTIYLVVGVNTLTIPARRFAAVAPEVGPFLDHPLWGLMWLGGGLVAIAVALRPRWVQGDGRGFTALLVPPFAWTLFYAASVVSYLLTAGEWGRVQSLSGAAVWSIAWATVLLIAGWPDPDATPRGR